MDYTVSKIDGRIIEFSGKIVELKAKLEATKHKYNQNLELRESSFMEKRLEKLPRRSGRLEAAVLFDVCLKMQKHTVCAQHCCS